MAAAPSVLAALKAQRRRQIENQLRGGSMWDNAHNLIFTNATGGLMPRGIWSGVSGPWQMPQG